MLLHPLLKEKRFDAIDCQGFPYFPVFSCRIASSLNSLKLFVTWYEFWGDYWYKYLGWPLGFFGKIFENLALALSTNIIAISEFTKRKLKKGNVNVVSSGIDYTSIRKAKPLKKRFDVIYVGRLIKDKNVDLLIRAIALMKAKYPKIRCCIAGDGPEKPKVIELASSQGLKGNVEFRNFFKTEEQVFSYLKSSRVLALPSSREGLGMIALEANACGIPVVTVEAEDNAAKELIKDGVNGRVVHLSAEALAAGIEDSFKIRVKPSKEYGWKEVADKLEELYNA
jgi:glycosyltransferase involved in cell wall biosynthesis